MRIEVLGVGCPRCEALAANAEAAAKRLGIEYELVKVTDLARIAKYGVLVTPALVVDGRVRTSGTVAAENEIEEFLKSE